MSYKRMKFKIKPQLVILATTLIGAQLGLATPVIIDRFLTTQATGTISSGTAHSQQNVGSAEVIGANRILDLAWVSGNPGFTTAFQAQGGANVLTLNAQNSVTSSGLATYCGTLACGADPLLFDGTINTTTPTAFGLGSVDLTGGGTNTQIRIVGNSDQNVTIWATFYMTSGAYARASYILVGDQVNHITKLRFDNTGDALFTDRRAHV